MVHRTAGSARRRSWNWPGRRARQARGADTETRTGRTSRRCGRRGRRQATSWLFWSLRVSPGLGSHLGGHRVFSRSAVMIVAGRARDDVESYVSGGRVARRMSAPRRDPPGCEQPDRPPACGRVGTSGTVGPRAARRSHWARRPAAGLGGSTPITRCPAGRSRDQARRPVPSPSVNIGRDAPRGVLATTPRSLSRRPAPLVDVASHNRSARRRSTRACRAVGRTSHPSRHHARPTQICWSSPDGTPGSLVGIRHDETARNHF